MFEIENFSAHDTVITLHWDQAMLEQTVYDKASATTTNNGRKNCERIE